MSGTISFGKSNDAIWLVKGWAFRRLLGELRMRIKDNEKAVEELDRAAAFQSLSIYSLRESAPTLARLFCEKIKEVCEDYSSDFERSNNKLNESETKQSPAADLTVVELNQYLEGLRELASIVEACGNTT